MSDKRTRDYRDGEILDTVIRTGGISPLWLKANPNRPAALERVKAAGLIREVDGSFEHFQRFEIVPHKPTLWERFCEWARGVDHG